MAAGVALPPEIRIIESLEVVQYCLPRRRAPKARLLGAVGVAVFGLPLVWGVTIWMARSCDGGGAAVLVVIGLLITSSVLVNVLFHFMGRAEVELGGGELRAIERVGPFRKLRRLPVVRVSRLVVGHLTSRAGRDNNPSAMLADEPRLAAILAEVEGGEPMILAPGYPRAWLLAMTQDLARRVKDSALDPLFDPPPLKIAVVEIAVDAHGFLERPSGSGIVVEHHPDEVTFIVPPPGVGRDARGCVFLLVGVMFLTGALLCMLGAAGIVTLQGDPWAALGVCLLCGLILLTGAIELGRRRVVLVVAGFTLRVTTDSPFRYREHFWPRAELYDIDTGPSNQEINDRPLPELQIHLRTGKKFGFLVGRDPEELEFLATSLRRALHMPGAAVEQHHKPWS
jgi:hypothetical protein